MNWERFQMNLLGFLIVLPLFLALVWAVGRGMGFDVFKEYKDAWRAWRGRLPECCQCGATHDPPDPPRCTHCGKRFCTPCLFDHAKETL